MPYEIGKVYKRCDDLIYITGTKHIKSLGINHMTWRIVKKNGKLGEEGSGYGELSATPIDCDIQIKIKLKEDGISLG